MPNWDPDVKQFFLRILNSVALGLMWILAAATAGLYYELGYAGNKPVTYTVIFYIVAVATLALLLRYLARTWKNK